MKTAKKNPCVNRMRSSSSKTDYFLINHSTNLNATLKSREDR